MKLLVDAQLSPSIAAWINRTFDTIEADSAWVLGLKSKSDQEIYSFAKEFGYVIMSKDSDFLDILKQFGSPPNLIWLTCGNTSNAAMRELLTSSLPKVVSLMSNGETIVEISDKYSLY